MILLLLFFLKQTFRLHIVGCLRLRTGGGEDTRAWISVPRDGLFHHEVTPPQNNQIKTGGTLADHVQQSSLTRCVVKNDSIFQQTQV